MSWYLVEYKCQPRAFKETVDSPQYIQLREEGRPTSPGEEASTSAAMTLREQPSTPAVGSANILERGPLAAIEDVPKAHKGMHQLPYLNISENVMEGFGDLFSYGPGSNSTTEVE